MLWFYLALVAAALYAAVNIIDKYVISGFFKKPMFQLFISGIVGLAIASGIAIFWGITVPGALVLAACLASGAFTFAATFFYFRALFGEEVSRAIPVLFTIPLWVLVLATVFLGETLSTAQYVGMALLVLGAILVSIKKTTEWRACTGLGLMTLASILYAANDVLLKYATDYTSFWNAFFWSSLSLGAISAALFLIKRKEAIATIKRLKKASALSAGSEAISTIASVLLLWSFALGLVSLSTAVTAVQPFFVLLFATLLSVFWPRIIKEELKASALGLKIIAVLLTVVGSILII